MQTTIHVDFKPDRKMGAAIYNLAVMQPEVDSEMMRIANAKADAINAEISAASGGRIKNAYRPHMNLDKRSKKLVSIALSNGNYKGRQRDGVAKLALKAGCVHW